MNYIKEIAHTTARTETGLTKNMYLVTFTDRFAEVAGKSKIHVHKWDDLEPCIDDPKFYEDYAYNGWTAQTDPLPASIQAALDGHISGIVRNAVNDKAREIVGSDVYVNATMMVDYILQKSLEGDRDAPYDWESVPWNPDPVSEEWDMDQMLEAMSDYDIEWADAMEYGLLIDPDECKDYVDEWTGGECADAILEYHPDWDMEETIAEILDIDPEDPNSREVPDPSELTGEDLEAVQEWCKENLDIDPEWPESDTLDYRQEDELREYLRDNIDFEPREIYEWWLVSGWLGDKLDRLGYIVIDDELYGREGTGQALYMDPNIQQVAKNLLDL